MNGLFQKTIPRRLPLVCALLGAMALFAAPARAQDPPPARFPRASQSAAPQAGPAETELQRGIALTRQGAFAEAIPHLLAARGHVAEEYAADFDLALCYVGTRRYKQAIQILTHIGHGDAEAESVNNLLAQAYIGDGQWGKGLLTFQRAAALQPRNEKLYLFIADAYEDQAAYALGLQVVEAGLKNLPQSARLTYQQGVILSQLNRTARAEKAFDRVSELTPGGEFSYLAAAQADLLRGRIEPAVQVARAGIGKGYRNDALFTLFGQAVDRSGMGPERPEFREAEKVLEEALAGHPALAPAQISLGKLMLRAGNIDGAIAHLEAARSLDPGDPSIYSHLASAYRQRGDFEKAQAMLAILAKLNEQQAARYKSGSPSHKIGYVASAAGRVSQPIPHHP